MTQEETLQLLVKKIDRIEKTISKIESELDEVIYPPEEKIRGEFVERVEKASKGNFTHYKSPNEFFDKLERKNV